LILKEHFFSRKWKENPLLEAYKNILRLKGAKKNEG